MKETGIDILNYLLKAGMATLFQLFVLFGPFIVLALVMNFLARKNEALGYRIFGQKVYLYVFGWLGTAVHELGHALFALLFAHKISELKLFSPGSGKSLGHVKHSYKKGDPYQTIGNFFIGIGPILLGTILLFLFTWLLFGLNIFKVAEKHNAGLIPDDFLNIEKLKTFAYSIAKGVWDCMDSILTGPEANWWKLVLFFYFFYSVSSSITLSSSDVKGAFRGFLYFAVLLFFFNVITIWMGNFATVFFKQSNLYLTGFYFLVIVSLTLNVIFILVLFFLNFLWPLFSKK